MRVLPLSESRRDALLEWREVQKAQFDRTNSFRHPWEGRIEIDEDCQHGRQARGRGDGEQSVLTATGSTP